MTAVDAHQHFWREDALASQSWREPTGHEVLERGFEPADLRPGLAAAGIEKTVLIQSMDNAEENRRLALYARQAPFVAGVVAWLPLQDGDGARAELEALEEMEHLRGVRCLIGKTSLDWLSSPGPAGVLRELAKRQLAWDVVPVTPDQVAAVEAVATRFPDLTIVIDHLARPGLDTGDWEPWATQVTHLARHPNVFLKLSVGVDVLSAWPQWDVPRLAPYATHAVGAFTPARCMLASNWPVILLRASYDGALADLASAAAGAGLDRAELADIRGGTASRVYRLTD